MFRVQDDGADQAGQFRPRQAVLQVQFAVFISPHEPLGLQPGSGQLLGTGGFCRLDRAGQHGHGGGASQEQGYRFPTFHTRFLHFLCGGGLHSEPYHCFGGKSSEIGRQHYSATAVTHQR